MTETVRPPATHDTDPVTGPPRLSLPRLFLVFLRFGCLAFGGPVAQIAMVRQALVEEQRWIDRARFNRLLAVMQVLPGPEAHELCVHLGMVARGRWGGVLAGLGFMLPGLMLMLLAAWAYHRWLDGMAAAQGALLGVQIVVLAIIARAVQRIGGHILEDRLGWGIAIAAFAATLAAVPFWLVLATAGAVALLRARSLAAAATVVAAACVALALATSGGVPAAPGVPRAEAATLLALFVAGLKGGLLTFGGAYTAIPYVRDDTVGRGWLSDGNFLDGVAIAGVLPAPLVIFATFAGYAAGGVAGALAITAGMFLPAFAFSLVFFERLESIVDNRALHGLLAGVAAAVVGIIAATLVDLGIAVAGRVEREWAAAALFVVALAAAFRLRGGWLPPALILLGGIAGLTLAI